MRTVRSEFASAPLGRRTAFAYLFPLTEAEATRCRRIMNLHCAGVRSRPLENIARTSNVYLPAFRPLYVCLERDPHFPNPPVRWPVVASAHWKPWVPAPAANRKLASPSAA
jgi:hypothetical protein